MEHEIPRQSSWAEWEVLEGQNWHWRGRTSPALTPSSCLGSPSHGVASSHTCSRELFAFGDIISAVNGLWGYLRPNLLSILPEHQGNAVVGCLLSVVSSREISLEFLNAFWTLLLPPLPNHLASTSARLTHGNTAARKLQEPRKAMKENKNGSRVTESYGATGNFHHFQGSFLFFFNYPKGSALEICQQPRCMGNLEGEKYSVPPLQSSEGDANRAGSTPHTSSCFFWDWILNFTFIAFESDIFHASPPKLLKLCCHLKAGEVLP